VPLPDPYRLIALRANGVFTSADGDNAVPFYMQPTLGGGSHLRGFRELRFRDQNSVLLGAEYRWEAWWALDGALFVDAGTVAPSRRSLSLRDVELGYGIGFRLHSNRAFVTRLDLAFSREGFVPLLRFDHVF
jgi:outer membrane protein assembly factor BamA